MLRLVLDPAMGRPWHADPFGLLRPWNEVPALMGSAPPATPPSTGTGVVVCLMGWVIETSAGPVMLEDKSAKNVIVETPASPPNL